MQQIVSIVDSYAYRPMVRQVYTHAVFRQRLGRAADPAEVIAGIAASRTVLGALERLIAPPESRQWSPTLADLHLAPLMGYFTGAAEGRAMLATYPCLAAWFAAMAAREAYRETEPVLP
jgi:glutathione S-transferase